MKKIPLALTLGTLALSMALTGNAVIAAQPSSTMGNGMSSQDQDQLRTRDQDKIYLKDQDKLRTKDQDRLRTQDKLHQQDQLQTQDRERLRTRIRTVQQALNQHGAMLKPDGMMGPQTRAALRKFQRENGLQVTGTINTATEAKLGIQ